MIRADPNSYGPNVTIEQRPSTRSIAAVPAAMFVGYLIGTIPSADIATRLARTEVSDLRSTGSGNPGATNAAAVLGTRWGVAVLIADMGKGALAGVAGRAIGGTAGAYSASAASIAGHIVPVWSGGRGGKGVATSAGACAAVFPAFFPIDTAVAVIGAVTSRNAERAVWMSCTAWIVSSLLWWRRRLPNAWGPEPTGGLPIFAVAGSAMIIAKFRAARGARVMMATPHERVASA